MPWCKIPADKVALQTLLKQFMAPLVIAPPRIVMVFFAGHGIRDGDNMYLVPAKAELKQHSDLKEKCLSHHELFGLLKTELEDRIHVKDVLFLVILDMCQNLPAGLKAQLQRNGELAHWEGEPSGNSRPMHWALCTSTANRTAAPDGPAGHNSPFTQELLSAECGFLEHNVSIQHALQTARSRLLQKGGQEPYLFHGDLEEICLSGPSTCIGPECDVFICHRECTELQDIARALNDELVKFPVTMEDADSKNLKVFFEPSFGVMPRHQIADALCSSTVVVFLVSQSTFDGIGDLRADSSDDGTLTGILTQYEMALEMFEQKGVVVLPVLIGDKSPGQSFYGQVNLSDKDQICKYWPVYNVPKDLRVHSIVKSALAGLRRDFNVAQNLANKQLKTRVPSILQSSNGKVLTAGRTIHQTLTAYSNTKNFLPFLFCGQHAVRDACAQICRLVREKVPEQDLIQTQANCGKRGRGVESVDEKSKLHKNLRDTGDCSGESFVPQVGVAEAGASAEPSSKKRAGHGGDSSPIPKGQMHLDPTFASALVGGISEFRYHVFISHNSDLNERDHKRVKELDERLRGMGYVTRFNDGRETGHTIDKMAEGVQKSLLVLVCVSRSYVSVFQTHYLNVFFSLYPLFMSCCNVLNAFFYLCLNLIQHTAF